MSVVVREATECRVCGGPLASVLDFGNPYISDFLEPGQEGVRAPLHVMACQRCGLAQLKHAIDPDLLWRGAYWYKSGTNESMVVALRTIAERAAVGLRPGDRVLDIGANDGTLLSFYPDFVTKVAVDPIASFKSELHARADVVVRDLWPTEIEGGFKRITSIACFYDADDPHAFVAAIKEALAPDGQWIVQLQDSFWVREQHAVDYWCHEHACLYGWGHIGSLLAAHGLRIASGAHNDVNGGSLCLVVEHGEADGIYRPEHVSDWLRFADRADKLRRQGVHELEQLAYQGDRVFGVAASTKFNTILQWYGITRDLLPCIIERAPEKIGKETVGTRIPIVSEADAPPADYYLAGAWHFLDGLRRRSPDVPFLTLLPDVKTYAPLRGHIGAHAV